LVLAATSTLVMITTFMMVTSSVIVASSVMVATSVVVILMTIAISQVSAVMLIFLVIKELNFFRFAMVIAKLVDLVHLLVEAVLAVELSEAQN